MLAWINKSLIAKTAKSPFSPVGFFVGWRYSFENFDLGAYNTIYSIYANSLSMMLFSVFFFWQMHSARLTVLFGHKFAEENNFFYLSLVCGPLCVLLRIFINFGHYINFCQGFSPVLEDKKESWRRGAKKRREIILNWAQEVFLQLN